MTAGELAGLAVLGVLVAVVLGAMAWLDWSAERDQAARRARQQHTEAWKARAGRGDRR
jgi:hypothetical protein